MKQVVQCACWRKMLRQLLLCVALLLLPPLVASKSKAKVPKPVNERLLESAQAGDATTVADLISQHGAEPDAVDAFGTSAMLNAAWAGHTSVVRVLLAHGASVDMQDKGGDYAVLVCVCSCSRRGAEWIRTLGARIDCLSPTLYLHSSPPLQQHPLPLVHVHRIPPRLPRCSSQLSTVTTTLWKLSV
jgi:hypothetical protein|mmetsp:Transcript_17632/g.52697  ORF Transcript_17632/g.52697 Transcript_17632/m.52697 type:complete len:187 (+) Transcript_17632:100-660(+)